MGLLHGYTYKMGEFYAGGKVLARGLIINCQSRITKQHLLFVIVSLPHRESWRLIHKQLSMQSNFE